MVFMIEFASTFFLHLNLGNEPTTVCFHVWMIPLCIYCTHRVFWIYQLTVIIWVEEFWIQQILNVKIHYIGDGMIVSESDAHDEQRPVDKSSKNTRFCPNCEILWKNLTGRHMEHSKGNYTCYCCLLLELNERQSTWLGCLDFADACFTHGRIASSW